MNIRHVDGMKIVKNDFSAGTHVFAPKGFKLTSTEIVRISMNVRAVSCGGQFVTKMQFASITTGIMTVNVKMDTLVTGMDISLILGLVMDALKTMTKLKQPLFLLKRQQ